MRVHRTRTHRWYSSDIPVDGACMQIPTSRNENFDWQEYTSRVPVVFETTPIILIVVRSLKRELKIKNFTLNKMWWKLSITTHVMIASKQYHSNFYRFLIFCFYVITIITYIYRNCDFTPPSMRVLRVSIFPETTSRHVRANKRLQQII